MTEVRICDEHGRRYGACAGAVRGREDLVGLVESCIEQAGRGLLIEAHDLPPEFFDLKTGQAGELLQKLQNYRIRLALVLSAEQSSQGRFGEMVREANRGTQLRVFAERTEAGAWLAAR